MAERTPERDQELLEVARGGDEDAFRRLVEPHRRELHAHCYRMLGSVHDAEDALQEALLRAWRGLAGFEGRGSLRSWLYTIATNVCLDLIGSRPKRGLPTDFGPAADPADQSEPPLLESVSVEAYPDEALNLEEGFAAPAARYEQREAIELAFIVALQHLPPRQRAVLILRDVLGFSGREVAGALGTTVGAVNGVLHRARQTVEERLPDESQQATLRSLGDRGIRQVVEPYMDAWERGDVDAIVAMLVEDATMAMPPMALWYSGREAVAVFLATQALLMERWRFVPVRANGQLAFGTYTWDAEKGSYIASAVDVLTLRGTKVKAITAFIDPAIFPTFDLPDELSP